ncbi:pimeloyl-ACP methyl ester carboxylesterase [Isoptericola jiangsuensis]|uniref:Pimeloyl-ACP methyl ester carboxylesterase n=1 Tax=Isoptericola jiangsuensis TaxID=548579 RepID=A0A2A9F0E6_9MICO|nr:alpha/beta hydrolase [Isoptericola jiangsuensis]PFG44774.1 pimeloyl-ACP methyl ester carboxylesterase [Isoptericola jiangsuensis]
MSAPVTVVLVHGAFAESSSWSGVIALLTEAGVAAVATPNPLRSVSGDAENVRRAVEGIGGPVVLVGHSYGGAVITEAAVDDPAVVGLVYVAAFAPDHGENALELTGRFPGSTLGETVRPYPLGDGTHDLVVDRDLFHGQFAADVPAADAAIQARTQRPIRDFALGEAQPAPVPAWKTLPSWFVFGDADKNIPVEGLRFMAERAGAVAIQEIAGASHSVMVSQPEAVADLIIEAVRKLSA